jgi:hypothetical protein
VDPEASNLSNQVRCSPCQRAPRDDADYVGWEALEEGRRFPRLPDDARSGNAPGERMSTVAV